MAQNNKTTKKASLGNLNLKPKKTEEILNQNKAVLSPQKAQDDSKYQKEQKSPKKALKMAQNGKKKPGPKSEKKENVEYVKISVRIQAEIKQQMKQVLANQAYKHHKTQDSFIETAIQTYLSNFRKK